MGKNIQPSTFFNAIAGPVVYDDDSPYQQMVKRIDDIDTIYFQSENRLVADEIADRLSPAIKAVILKELSAFGESLIRQSDEIEARILNDVEALVKSCASDDCVRLALSEALVQIHHLARRQLPILVNSKYCCSYTSRDIRSLHEAAIRVTLFEHLTRSNDKDVMAYYHAVIYHTAFACYKLTRRKASQFLLHMVDVVSRQYDLQSPVATIFNDPPSAPDTVCP